VDNRPLLEPEEEATEAEEVPADTRLQVPIDLSVSTPITPADGPLDLAELNPEFFHLGTKSLDAIKINTMALGYEELRDESGNYIIKTNTNVINDETSEKVLKPNALKVGDAVRLVVDEDYKGSINKQSGPGQKKDDFQYYTDENGLIGTSEALVGNVPIKIVDVATGETLGYLPRLDWVTAQYPDALDYRNIVDSYESGDVIITDNVKAQARRLMLARKKVVERYNNNNGPTLTRVDKRGPGKVVMNVEPQDDGKSIVVPRLASKLLPDPSLKIGIVSGGVVKVGLSTMMEGALNTTDLGTLNNSPFVILPMADGSFSLGRLNNHKLADRPFDVDTVVHALETYLAQDATTAQQYMDLTGFDILSDDGIRAFINQHYTYTQSFPDTLLSANGLVLD